VATNKTTTLHLNYVLGASALENYNNNDQQFNIFTYESKAHVCFLSCFIFKDCCIFISCYIFTKEDIITFHLKQYVEAAFQKL